MGAEVNKMSDKYSQKTLSSVLDILKTMTESGAEIYRIEEGAERIFKAYGAKKTDVYATTSNIIVSIESEDGVIKTHTKRIGRISTDLEKLDRLNSLLRFIEAETPDNETIEEEMIKIKAAPKYSNLSNVCFHALIACVFYLFFGGRNVTELIVASILGAITGVINVLQLGSKYNKFLQKFACSFISCLLSFLLLKLSVISSVDYIIIANIMALIPGIGLTNALRDLFVGDSISGVLGLIETALLALSIACGYIVVTIMFGGVIA